MKESWLDKAILAIAPGWGKRRLANKAVAEQLRGWNYDAGDGRPHNQNWRMVNDSGENTDKWDRDRVRARARDLERNSDQMNAIIDAVVRNVYGPGWNLQVKIGDGTKRDYTKLNKQIEAAWEKWKRPRNCDVTGTQSFDQIIRMCVRRKKVDGGILIVKRYTKDGFIPFKLQVLEVDELDESVMSPYYKKGTVVGGIEYDQNNRPLGYWFRQYDIDGMREIEPTFVKADDVIFYFTKQRPSQIREMSDLSPTIMRIRDVNQYLEAVAVKERIQACLSIFIKKQTPGSTGFGRSGIPTTESHNGGYSGKTLSPGMMTELNPGDDVVSVNPTGQAQNASEFVKLQQKMMAAGQGMSYETVSRDMSETNYSSARQGAIEDERTFAAEQEALEVVMDEIYETFLISLVLANEVNIPDFWQNKDKYFSHAWIMPAKKWIDPIKEANANTTALLSGQKTFQTLCAETGRNWKDVLDETSEVQKYAEKLGISMAGILVGVQEKQPENEPQADTDNGSPQNNDSADDNTKPEGGEANGDGEQNANEGSSGGTDKPKPIGERPNVSD